MAERIGNILRHRGIIGQTELDFCLGIQKNNVGELLGRVLKHYDFADEEQIAQALSEQSGWPLYMGSWVPDSDAMSLFGVRFFKERLVFPVRAEDKGRAFVMARPDDLSTIDSIRACLNTPINFFVTSEQNIRQALEKIDLDSASLHHPPSDVDKDDLVGWLDLCLDKAVGMGATDIHIEPSQKAVEVRFRIDGILYFMEALRLNQLSRIVNIIFHKAEVTVSDFGHFHDARFTHIYLNRCVDVRISHIPSVAGSSLVLRLLDKGKTMIDLRDLGYAGYHWDAIVGNLIKPEGLVIVAGPTGCGKSTTLYAMLNYLKSISRKIVTVEDPVEMHLPLMTQVQIHDKKDISFAAAIRAFLRHDPNIILVGEIRDQETAKEAMRAAMTGHKVFATLHANRPVDALLRLNDLGVPYMHIAGNINMVITQRLMRTLCPACKYSVNIARKCLLSHAQKYVRMEEQTTCHPKGCVQCRDGYKGRTVAAEVLSISNAYEDLIASGRMSELRHEIYRDERYKTLHDDAARLISEGLTSVDEAVRVLG